MPWLYDHLNHELFRLSQTPITPLTLLVISGAALIAVFAGPAIRAGLARSLMGQKAVAPASRGAGRFGAFTGVFTPSILTILGVIMYLRVGWVVGNAGLAGALFICLISHLITGATGLSVSSIATNRTVGVGGAYFIISRSLGAPVGAAIGIPLFFGQALSITFYIVGFTESLTMLFPNLPQVTVSSLVLLILALISMKSADLALKVQYVVMAAIVLSLVSFFSGTPDTSMGEAAGAITWWVTDKAPFAEVFAVFFPAVTGIMAGVGMSGDLKDPRRAIPKGTMWAIVVGFVVYMTFPVWLALNASSADLADDKMIVWDVAKFGALIYVGVWGATLSSAVGSILTAPRTLQALANDGLVPRFLGRGSGPNNEPRMGVLISYLFAQAGILMGGLDVIAPVLTMFFLATYGLINLACGLERWAASPSFRPDFTVPAAVGIIAGLACFYVMSIINMPAMIAAAILCGTIYVITQRRALSMTYGDARHGIWAAIVRSALQRMRQTEYHALNWRPNLLILGGDYEKRPWLLTLGSVIVQDRGIVTFVELMTGDIQERAKEWREAKRTLDDRIHQRFPNVFARVEVVHDKYRGSVSMAQAYGLGKIEANTVMLGWLNKSDKIADYVQMLRDLASLDRSLLVVHYDKQRKFGKFRQIHIWWGGLQGNGGLMLLLAYLMTAHDAWRSADVSIHTVVDDEAHQRAAEAGIRQVMASARVDAQPVVVLREGRAVIDIMHEQSKDADLAIAGLRLPPRDSDPDQFFERMNALLAGMPTTILVHSSRNFEGEPVLFDEGAPDATPADNGDASG